MARLPPDANDGYVWLLNETSGAYKNTGRVLPGSASTDLTISGTVIRTATGIFGDNCAYFPGVGNYPSGASATRNYISGAHNINPVPPFTISAWIYLRNYQSSNTTQFLNKHYRDPSLVSSWTTPFISIGFSILASNGGGDWQSHIATSTSTFATRIITDFPIPTHQWCHIGLTHDGTAVRLYLNGILTITYSGGTQLTSTSTVAPVYNSPPGPWVLGAIAATGSSNKEEANLAIQDFRIANVVRPLTYFQLVYNLGVFPRNFSNLVRYYKLRAYDTSCEEVTFVEWVDTEISLANAPTFPCTGPYSTPEVIDTCLA